MKAMTTATRTMDARFAAARQTLEGVGQAHVLKFYDALDDAGRQRLLSEIEGIDWPEVARLIESHVRSKPEFKLPGGLEPAPYYPREPRAEDREKYAEARRRGETLLRGGKVAAFIVAGGQGTRLGWDAPKGTFPATPIRKAPLFQVFAEFVRKAGEKYGSTIPLYVMTSPANDAATRAFFDEHQHFGLGRSDVMIFPQAMMPAIDMETHKVLLADRGALALSPNGHGGSLKALYHSGAIADMKKRGIEHVSYVQVDNPNVKVLDPMFLGLHDLDAAQMSSKMLPKAYPKEKVGVFCVVDGRVSVIEYSDFPDELAEQRDEAGQLRFLAGSIAIHAIRVDFIESLNTAGGGGEFSLPFHRAEKKVPHLDLDTGREVSPDKPNAVKLETFVFDALPLCTTSVVFETDRVEEFAPIKNADASGSAGEAPDSPASSKRLQSERAGRWLQAVGVNVPRTADGGVDAVIEIAPLTAIEPDDLRGVELPSSLDPGDELLL
jgi:UDP-N-acetylglucosamine/UDP-N-acetylgalactosamine diphosphorylase